MWQNLNVTVLVRDQLGKQHHWEFCEQGICFRAWILTTVRLHWEVEASWQGEEMEQRGKARQARTHQHLSGPPSLCFITHTQTFGGTG